MRDLILSRTTMIWGLLVAATLLSWELGHGPGFATAKAAGTAILVLAFVKVRFVMLEFMELRDAPRWMRVASQAWIVGVSALLVTLLLLPH